eukprot:scaffold26796_cov69-Phaeocystis_antarctica.AAC.1
MGVWVVRRSWSDVVEPACSGWRLEKQSILYGEYRVPAEYALKYEGRSAQRSRHSLWCYSPLAVIGLQTTATLTPTKAWWAPRGEGASAVKAPGAPQGRRKRRRKRQKIARQTSDLLVRRRRPGAAVAAAAAAVAAAPLGRQERIPVGGHGG